MLLSKYFLKTLVLTHRSCSTICGQMITYNPKKLAGFEVSSKKGTRTGYQLRCVLFIMAAVQAVCRLLVLGTRPTKDFYNDSSRLEASMCIMMTIISILVAERYRVRGKFRFEYVAYYNGILLAESKYEKGLIYFYAMKLLSAKFKDHISIRT